MNKILSLIIIFSIIFFQNINTFAYNQSEVISITQSLQNLPKGEKYIQTLDLFANKYENNLESATKIQSNITRVLHKYKDSNHKDIELVILILKYLDIKFQSIIDSYNDESDTQPVEEDTDDSENTDDTDDNSQEIVYTKDALYPGFSSYYDDDNKKSILAGVESFIYNGSLVANIEEIEVEKMEFTLQGSDLSNFKYGFKEAILYVEGHKAQSISSSRFSLTNSSQGVLEFDSIDGVFVPKEEIEFRLALIPQEIGYEKLGKFIPEVTVSQVKVTEGKGVISGADISMKTLSGGSETFQITPVILNIGVEKTLNDSSVASFNIQIDSGNNTKKSSSSELKAQLDSIKLSYLESFGSATFKLYNQNDSSSAVIGVKNGGFLEFDLSGLGNQRYIGEGKGETFTIQISAPVDSNISLDIINQGIIYSVEGVDNANNINANLQESISLGNRKY